MFDHGAQPNSVEDWLALAAREEAAAHQLVNDKNLAAMAWTHAGSAVECALKAAIMAHTGMNRWPERTERPDLYDHDLQKLASLAGITISPRDQVAASWVVVLRWRRGQTYNPKRMPRRVARDMLGAAFGSTGIVPWIRSTFLRRT